MPCRRCHRASNPAVCAYFNTHRSDRHPESCISLQVTVNKPETVTRQQDEFLRIGFATRTGASRFCARESRPSTSPKRLIRSRCNNLTVEARAAGSLRGDFKKIASVCRMKEGRNANARHRNAACENVALVELRNGLRHLLERHFLTSKAILLLDKAKCRKNRETAKEIQCSYVKRHPLINAACLGSILVDGIPFTVWRMLANQNRAEEDRPGGERI
ncbi:hypothetical protein SAMN04488026_101220 [Aliiruegeria lutimaris]|uniref:Uncharacterized protein n=1 Tax=Aliiruegeria lutimaris TaxID=571298 RepID=A0A1G8R0I6_9RHOB|nr:hypothetical protein SAMN04488026_101220 [Aliiruegeria lutimaris]